jgi:hypothetical protein
MSLNLSSNVLKSNVYLNEIEILRNDTKIQQTQTNLNTSSLLKLNTNLNDSFNINYKAIGTKHFNDDVVCYLDFSDNEDLGKDISGGELHGVNINGVVHSEFNTHSAYFDKVPHTSVYRTYPNQRYIDMSKHIAKVQSPEFSISFVIAPKASNTVGSVFSFTDNRSIERLSYFSIDIDASRIRLYYIVDGVYIIHYLSPVLPLVNGLYYVTLTSDSSGHEIYVNDILINNGYAIGTNTDNCDLMAFDPLIDSFTIGALRQGSGYIDSGLGYKYPFDGYLCDFMIHNRVLTRNEISMYANGVVGYDVILLGGQSNMTGQAVVIPGIDDDYSEHNNRVIQYKTRYNVDLGDPTKYSSLGTNGYNTNVYELAAGQLDYPELNYDNKVGPWRTFMNDYITKSKIPFRKKVIFVPIAMYGNNFANNWLPTKNSHQIALMAVNQVFDETLNPAQSCLITCMLFNLGEGDIVSLNTNYKNDFITMYSNFVNYMVGFNDQVPVILTEISGEYETYVGAGDENMQSLVNIAIKELVNDDDIFNIALTGGLNYMSDRKHIDIEGQRLLGTRMYDSFAEIAYNKATSLNNNVDNMTLKCNLKLEPKSEILEWENLNLNCFAEKIIIFTGTGAYVGNIILKFVKLGPIVFVSMVESLTFAAAQNDKIYTTINIPDDLLPVDDYKYIIPGIDATRSAHVAHFLSDGTFIMILNIASEDTSSTIYEIDKFNCMYYTNN